MEALGQTVLTGTSPLTLMECQQEGAQSSFPELLVAHVEARLMS